MMSESPLDLCPPHSTPCSGSPTLPLTEILLSPPAGSSCAPLGLSPPGREDSLSSPQGFPPPQGGDLHQHSLRAITQQVPEGLLWAPQRRPLIPLGSSAPRRPPAPSPSRSYRLSQVSGERPVLRSERVQEALAEAPVGDEEGDGVHPQGQPGS